MLLEIPFTDKVKPKPKLSSEARGKRSAASDADDGEPARGRGCRPPAAPNRSEARDQSKNGTGAAIRSAATPPPNRASGSPAQWLRSASCDRPQPERTFAVLEKLPATRSRPSLDAYSSDKLAPCAPPTPQGEGDVSQLQDALAHALCDVEGVHVDPTIHTIPEEILSATVEAGEVPTMLLESKQVHHLLDGTGADSASPEWLNQAAEGTLGELSMVSDWKDTYG